MDAGFKDVEVSHWAGIFAPAKTPKEMVTQLNRAANDVLADPSVKEALLNSGAVVTPMSVEEFTEFVKAETGKYAKLVEQEFCSRPWSGGCAGLPV